MYDDLDRAHMQTEDSLIAYSSTHHRRWRTIYQPGRQQSELDRSTLQPRLRTADIGQQGLRFKSALLQRSQELEMSKDVKDSTIHFLRPNPLHRTEKPYAFRFDPGEGVEQSNFSLEPRGGISVHDLRGREREFNFEKNGFTVLKLPRSVPYEAYHDEEGVKTYLTQLEELLKSSLSASHVEVFRHGVSLGNNILRTLEF